jgi:phosphate transport system ATP-binding protein
MSDIISIRNLDFYYSNVQALKSINMDIRRNQITSLIGPSGCGKTTLLRLINRMSDLVLGTRVEGELLLDGINIFDKSVDVVDLRKRVGMVFQQPNPFPKSIFDNVAYGPRMLGMDRRINIGDIVEKSLKKAALWEEVSNCLHKSGTALSGGQQQRLCIARVLAVNPEIILMDEPCSALDPISTLKIEELMLELKKDYTVIIVTHNMQQAARVSDFAGFMLLGDLIEYGPTKDIFSVPKDKRTEDYITGRFG